MLRIIKDPNQTLNLNPLVVYFIFKPGEKARFEHVVESFNADDSLTLGIFKFKAVEMSRKSESWDILRKVIPDLKENMLVRLFEGADEDYYYGVDSINFNENPRDAIETTMSKVTHADRLNLRDFEKTLGEKSPEGRLFRDMAELLENAMKSTASNRFSENYRLGLDTNHLGRALPWEYIQDIRRIKGWDKRNPEIKDFVKKFNNLLEEYGFSSEGESTEIIDSANNIKAAYHENHKPESAPDFTLVVEAKREDKYGKKHPTRFLIQIVGAQGEMVVKEIKFTLKDSKIIYLAALICKSMDLPLYREAFFKNPELRQPMQTAIK